MHHTILMLTLLEFYPQHFAYFPEDLFQSSIFKRHFTPASSRKALNRILSTSARGYALMQCSDIMPAFPALNPLNSS